MEQNMKGQQHNIEKYHEDYKQSKGSKQATRIDKEKMLNIPKNLLQNDGKCRAYNFYIMANFIEYSSFSHNMEIKWKQ